MHDVWENTVRFAETDAQGIVFYGNYLVYQDETFVAYMTALGYPYERRARIGWKVHVVNVELDYRESATVGDELVNAMEVTSVGRSSLQLGYECRRKADDTVLVEGRLVYAGVDEDGESMAVPEEIREAIADFQGD